MKNRADVDHELGQPARFFVNIAKQRLQNHQMVS
jgi:hypothetical protein